MMPPGSAEPFKPCRHVNAVAIDVVTINDDIANIDADAELDALFCRDIAVALKHAALDVDGAAHRVNHADEFHQHSISGGLNNSAAMFGDLGVD